MVISRDAFSSKVDQDLFAVGMLPPLFNRRGRELGESPSMIGLVGSIYGSWLFTVLVKPNNGKASDVWSRKSVLLLSFIGCFIGNLYMGLASTILMYALARLPTGLLKHSHSSAKAYLSDITLPEERSGVFGWFNAFGSFGFIISPIICATVAMHDNGYFKVSLLSCSVYLFAIIFVWFVLNKIKLGNDKQNDKEKSFFSRIVNVVAVSSIVSVFDLLLIRIIMALGMLIYRSNFTAMLDYRYGVNAKTTGYIISYGSIAGAISGMSLGSIYSYIQSDVNMMSIGGSLMMAYFWDSDVTKYLYSTHMYDTLRHQDKGSVLLMIGL
ncbi:major facilitator superfamily domain-containing protein 9-like [Xenia sp. Carnegie-2017]|uniref:major facilitator superfamily domain-containing protein 9-like n=1 Tax=Xenia sp. Carnegie-2017 TaxID=2897299 RepID=UPI001F042DF2|nr:major facilitator superfamily domain-containing protein 9-like [Xenia sp. Carnegie-2017]